MVEGSGNLWNRNFTSASQDSNSPYYIHPSDANTTQLVYVKFNGNGYSNWKRSMLLSLSAKYKKRFFDGTATKPHLGSNDYKAWERCNDLVCLWLLCNLDDSISKSVLFFNTAKEIWDDLDDRFGFASMTQVFSIEQQLAELTQGTKSVSEFFTKIKTLWDALNDASPLPCCTCNKCICNVNQKVAQMQQNHRLLQFMMRLGERYAVVRGNILMQHPMPSLTSAFKMFSQEERHQELSQLSSQTESLAFVANNSFVANNRRNYNNATSRNFRLGYKNSGDNNYKWSVSSGSSDVKKGGPYFCTHCKISGHSNDRCFKLHGYPPNFKGFREKRVVAAASQNNQSDQETASANSENSGTITIAQIQQQMELLNKQS